MNMMLCPYCEQDGVWEVSINEIVDEVFLMCFECDTIWAYSEKIMNGTGLNFETFMENRDEKPDWSSIKKIRPLNN